MLISIVCPMYNEQANIAAFLSAVSHVLEPTDHSFEIVCVNDGSSDDTLNTLIESKTSTPQLRVINLSRNFGKEAALSAGLSLSNGDVVIPIDADLQDPPELIIDMLEQYQQGYDVVVGRRVDRRSDTFTKRTTADLFYRLIGKISPIEIPPNVGDFRLMSRRVVDALDNLPENQRFMKGMFAWVGFETTYVDYVRPGRVAGNSTMSNWRLWNLALEGITSFSTAPLRIWTYLGASVASLAFLYGLIMVLKTLIWGIQVPGYASLVTIILFLGGMQLVGIGIIGEYIGRIYMESKKRPTYIVEKEY